MKEERCNSTNLHKMRFLRSHKKKVIQDFCLYFTRCCCPYERKIFRIGFQLQTQFRVAHHHRWAKILFFCWSICECGRRMISNCICEGIKSHEVFKIIFYIFLHEKKYCKKIPWAEKIWNEIRVWMDMEVIR